MLGQPIIGTQDTERCLSWHDNVQGLRFRTRLPVQLKEEPETQDSSPIVKKDTRMIQPAKGNLLFSDSELRNASSEQLMTWATSNKEQSVKLQESISIVNQETIVAVENFAIQNLGFLIYDRLGGYVLQRLLPRSLRLEHALVAYSLAHFGSTLANEYSSRVLELLVTRSVTFRSAVLRHCRLNLPQLLTSFPAVFVVSAAVAATTDEIERDIVSSHLASPEMMASKFFKRVLVTYIAHCSAGHLAWLGSLLAFETNLGFYLGDRYATQVLAASILRGCPRAIGSLLYSLGTSVYNTLSLKHFDFLINHLCSKDCSVKQLRSLFSGLARVSATDWQLIGQSAKKYRILCSSLQLLQVTIDQLPYQK